MSRLTSLIYALILALVLVPGAVISHDHAVHDAPELAQLDTDHVDDHRNEYDDHDDEGHEPHLCLICSAIDVSPASAPMAQLAGNTIATAPSTTSWTDVAAAPALRYQARAPPCS